MAQGFRSIALLAAQAADQKKGEKISLLDVRKASGITDYVLLANVLSPSHLESVEQAVDHLLKSSGIRLLHWDGSSNALWRVLDYGGLIIHLTHERAREFYQLDKLYHDARHVRWQERAKVKERVA